MEDNSREPEREAEPVTDMVPVGVTDPSVLGSTTVVSPDCVGVALLIVIEGTSLGSVGESMVVLTVGGSGLGSAGSVGGGVGSGAGSTDGGSATGSVIDGTGCIDPSCAMTEVTKNRVNMNKDRIVGRSVIRVR